MITKSGSNSMKLSTFCLHEVHFVSIMVSGAVGEGLTTV